MKRKEELSRIYRYFIVKCISKGEYVVIPLLAYIQYGNKSLPYAFVISFFFSNILDFLGQKYWVFQNKKEFSWKILRDVFLYISLRTINFLCAAVLFSLLTEKLHISMFAAGFGVALIFIPISFILYRWLFVGAVRDLLKTFK